MSKEIGVLGGGGQANELESYLDDETTLNFRALSSQYIDPNDPKQIDILNPADYQKNLAVVAAVGAPALRRDLIEVWPGENYATIIARQVYIDKSLEIGEGSIIAPGVVITTGAIIGRHTIINVLASISHDAKLGDFSTICPGVNIAGEVTLGEGTFVGIGASIKNNIRIAPGVVIGAGAVVVNDILEENAVFAGVPAKKVSQNNEWLRKI